MLAEALFGSERTALKEKLDCSRREDEACGVGGERGNENAGIGLELNCREVNRYGVEGGFGRAHKNRGDAPRGAVGAEIGDDAVIDSQRTAPGDRTYQRQRKDIAADAYAFRCGSDKPGQCAQCPRAVGKRNGSYHQHQRRQQLCG